MNVVKSLVCVAGLLMLCKGIWATEIYPYEGATEALPYLLNVHGCNLQGITVGSRFVPIQRELSYTALVLPRPHYWQIKSAVNQEISRAKESSSDLKKAKKKVSEFEEIGNIPALEHWERKAASIELEIVRSLNSRLLPEYARKIIGNESPTTYYGRSVRDRFKTNTLAELIEITGDNCVETMH